MTTRDGADIYPDIAPATPQSEPWITLLPYQRSAIESRSRFTWNCWSRQTGKSFTFSLRRLIRGLARRRHQIILSAGERQSREVMRKVRMHCQAMRIHSTWSDRPVMEGAALQSLEATLPGGVRILALPANPMTARGFTGDVFLDEFAMHRDDAEIWAALFPTLLRGEGELDIASTPRGRRNLFYRMRDNPQFAVSVVTLRDAIEQGLEANERELREGIDDEFAWRQEFCCEFLDEACAFLSLDMIHRCESDAATTSIDWTLLRLHGAEVFVGIDIGRFRDLTAIWLWRRDDDAYTTIGVMTLENTSFDDQERAIVEILSQRAVRRCCIDATGVSLHLSERLVERFGEHSVTPIVFTSATKSRIASTLRIHAERGVLRIPRDRQIVEDWHSVTRTASVTGHPRFEADRQGNSHADRFWAAALGLTAAEGCGPVGADFLTDGQLRFGGAGIW
ncbi:MAG: terminase family protein [Phycisphaerales bacterium]|nr:terminase family protein [Phycisphaerales bacterium]